MTSCIMKSVIHLMLILIGVSKSIQSPVATNYTSQLLRQSKAAEFMSYHSVSDQTCTNFYAQACEDWEKSNPASIKNPKTSHLGQIYDLYVRKSQELLKNYKGSEDSHAFVSKFYSSCTNKSQIDKVGLKPVLNHLDFKGGWPEIKNLKWYQEEFDWLKTIADIRRDLGLDLFIGLEVKPVQNYYGMRRIEVGAPKLPLGSKNKYLDDEFENERTEYKQKISDKLRIHFPNMTKIWRNEVADQVLDIEISLAGGLGLANGITAVQAAQLQKDQPVSQLNAKYSSFVDFSRYLSLIFGRPITEGVHEQLSDYFPNLLKVIEQTPKLTIANYTMWRVLDRFDFIPDMKKADYEIWCAEHVIKHFPAHVASLYATEYQTKSSDKIGVLLRKVFGDIKKALEIKLGQADKFQWMTAETRQKATEHFARLIFAEENASDLEKYLDNILYAMKIDQYYENLLQILQLKTKWELQSHPNDYSFETKAYSTARTPYYSSKHQEIVIPTEFLQPHVLFDPEYPNAVNYGTVGVLLAQELLRGLLLNDTSQKWWDTTTEKQFAERKNCFARQLGNYEFHGRPVNDKDGVFKFIIYTSAVEIAFDAYTAQKGIDQASEILSNQLNYGHERLFFLSFAEMYCADYYLMSFKRFSELPERILIKGALTNFGEFAEVFKCSSYTQMNTRNKCTIF